MWFAIISMLLYLISILLITPLLLKAQTGEQRQTGKPNKTLFFLTALFAIVFHFAALSALFAHLLAGQSFTLIEIGSLISAMIAALATAAMLLRVNTLWFLLPIVYCCSVISLILQTLLPSAVVQHLVQNIGLLIHIALALLAYAVCFIATLYAIQLLWLDRNLKNKTLPLSPIIPPLMTVERHFFRLMFSGELLLTLTLISGAFYLADFFAAQNIQKAIFSFLAWIVFGLSLLGHWKLHWRGKRMIIYTISGMILLTVGYFGSRVMFDI
ncbi:cytochrome C assembly family protein [Necropsobacter massiliensis]|uniref:cytochrome C assembly family protein n=1 Tax=Necropsobacter massiliensis TaxID=1400001 RepID=UPI000595DD52|nr:cytochrome c biogenesis protein CcsA [Necropsobacter massiliensis]